MIVRRDKGRARARDDVRHDGLALLGRAAAEDDIRAVALRGGDLGRRADGRHNDVGAHIPRAGRECEGLGVIACGGEGGGGGVSGVLRLGRWVFGRGRGDNTGAMRHDAVAQLVRGETLEGVGGAADLEGPDALVVFAFEEEVDLRRSRGLAFEGGADEGGGELRR